jgi:hypothetical protein
MNPDQLKLTRSGQTRLPSDRSYFETPEGVKALTDGVKRAKNSTARVAIVKEAMKGNPVLAYKLATEHLKSTVEILQTVQDFTPFGFQTMITSQIGEKNVKHVEALLYRAAGLAKTPDEARAVVQIARKGSLEFADMRYRNDSTYDRFRRVEQYAENVSQKLTLKQLTQ